MLDDRRDLMSNLSSNIACRALIRYSVRILRKIQLYPSQISLDCRHCEWMDVGTFPPKETTRSNERTSLKNSFAKKVSHYPCGSRVAYFA